MRDQIRSALTSRGAALAGVVLGTAMLAVNLVGILHGRDIDADDRSPLRYRHDGWALVDADTISLEEAERRLVRRPDESDEAYLRRATGVVNERMRHLWTWNERSPAHERLRLIGTPQTNYVMWLIGKVWFLPVNPFRPWIMTDPDLALERGLGTCSQHALILHHYLHLNGIENEIVNFSPGPDNHVVNEVRIGERVWIADADYGVLTPHGIAEVRENPALLEPHYREAWPEDAIATEYLTALRGPSVRYGNIAGRSRYLLWRAIVEDVSWVLVWALPVALIGLGTWRWRRERSPAPGPSSAGASPTPA